MILTGADIAGFVGEFVGEGILRIAAILIFSLILGFTIGKPIREELKGIRRELHKVRCGEIKQSESPLPKTFEEEEIQREINIIQAKLDNLEDKK